MKKMINLLVFFVISLCLFTIPHNILAKPENPTKKLELFTTDLDGTMFDKKTKQTDLHKTAIKKLKKFLSTNNIPAVFITGRNIQEIDEAIEKYGLPIPDYAAADVGTRIYKRERNKWQNLKAWHDELERFWSVEDSKKIHTLLSKIKGMEIQEVFRQNRFKISYYYKTNKSSVDVYKWLKPQVDALGLKITLLVSGPGSDPSKLFVDFLPINGAKDSAMLFVAKHIGADILNTYFSGNSGNDRPALLSPAKTAFVGGQNSDYAKWLKKNHPQVYITPSKQILGVVEGLQHYGYMK